MTYQGNSNVENESSPIKLLNSSLNITTSFFSNSDYSMTSSANSNGGFISDNGRSIVRIFNSEFDNGLAFLGGSIYSSEHSTLLI